MPLKLKMSTKEGVGLTFVVPLPTGMLVLGASYGGREGVGFGLAIFC